MKIRNGFVSNSSSTSFCLYGVEFDEDFDEDLLEQPEDRKNRLSVFSAPYDNITFMGLPLTECRDDETMGDFKKRVKDLIKRSYKKEIPDREFCVFEESWYDS
jgi:hypothetical protein